MLVDFARHVAEWFPELRGRSIAVSEVEPFKDKTNRPRLPMAVTALIGEQNTSTGAGGATAINIQSDVLLQFIFEPEKYKDSQNRDTPFFAFYDYERLRNHLLDCIRQYRSPDNHSIAYRTLDIDSDEFAVYIAFRLVFSGRLCAGETEAMDVRIISGVVPASTICKANNDLPSGFDCNPPVAHKPLTE